MLDCYGRFQLLVIPLGKETSETENFFTQIYSYFLLEIIKLWSFFFMGVLMSVCAFVYSAIYYNCNLISTQT